MIVDLLCVFVGEKCLIRAQVDTLALISQLKTEIHACMRLRHCRADEVRIFLAEKRRYRAWFKSNEDAVMDLRHNRAPPREFVRVYLSKGNELEADERIQDFLPERFIYEPKDMHIFAATPRPPPTAPSPPISLPDDEEMPAAAPRQPCKVVAHLPRNCKFPGCSKTRRRGGFCCGHGGGKPCASTGCTKKARSRGFCCGHGGGARCKSPEY